MFSHLTKYLQFLFLTGLLFFARQVQAQENTLRLIARIDSLIAVGLPKSALALDEQFDSVSRRNKDIAGQVRAAIFRVNLQSTLDENGQEKSINSLKVRIRQAGYPIKPVLQSILAQLYWAYYQQNRYRISQREQLQHADTDFTHWDLQTLLAQTSTQYELSLTDAVKEQSTPVSILGTALQGDTATRYLRPTLYDLLVHRAFDFFLSSEAGLTKLRLPFTLNDPDFFADGSSFTRLHILTTDTASNYYKGLRYLQQATIFHLQHPGSDALADIDLKRLEFVHTYSSLSGKDSLYLAALHRVAVSPISAEALVLQGRYEKDKENYKAAIGYFQQAVDTYPKSLGGQNAADYIKDLTQTTLTANVEEVSLPNKPLLAALTYRNLKAVRVTLYKIWATQYNELAAMRNNHPGYNRNIEPVPAVFSYLKKLKPLKTEDLQLPVQDDYRQHNTEFMIDPLKKGIYVLVVQDPASEDEGTFQLTAFKVSALTSVSRHLPDGRTQLLVMDRETGAPLPAVQVTINEVNTQTSDAAGSCYFNLNGLNQYAVKLTTTSDTLYTPSLYRDIIYTTNVNERKRVILFTDREIYRPGQTVYFKGLYIDMQNGSNKLLPGEKIAYVLKENYGKVLTSATETTNDFGSFVGSYVLPQTMRNGIVMITTPFGNKMIRVEEYKRPAFKIQSCRLRPATNQMIL